MIQLTQNIGDTKTFSIPLSWGGRPFVPGSDWNLLFTVKSSVDVPDSARLLQKQTSGLGITVVGRTASVEILRADTFREADYPNPDDPAFEATAGDYVWDIKATKIDDGETRTVASGTHTLIRPVGRIVEATGPIYTTEDPGQTGVTTWEELDGKPATFPPVVGAGAAAAYTDPRLSDARAPLPHDPSVINRAAASTGDALIWDGSAWSPAPPVAADTLTIKSSLTAPADTSVGWFDPETNVLSFWDYVNLVWVGTPFIANSTPAVPALTYLNPALQPYLDPSGVTYLAPA